MRPGFRLSAVAVVLVVSTLAWSACSGGGGDITEPMVGTLQITSLTTGPEPDADGYQVRVDDEPPVALGVNATLRLDGLEAGSHTVELGGLADNCTVAGDLRRAVGVTADAVATASFAVTCAPTSGAIAVTVSGTGPDDPDGYSISIDGAQAGTVGADGTLTLFEIPPGSHTVALGDLDGTCQVEGQLVRTIQVTAGATEAVLFAVTCAPPPPSTGSIEISVSSTGTPADPDGYTVTVDGGTPRPLAATAELTVDGLAPGTHAVLLGGLAGNCTAGGQNPRGVEVVAGASAAVAFTVACGPVTGSLAVTIGGLPEGASAAVTVTRPGGFSRPLTATATLEDLAPGDYTVAAAGVTVGGARYTASPETRTMSVRAGEVATATVTYTAAPAATLNLRIDGWYLSQGVQTADNSLPLLAGRDGYLRVFVVANESNRVAPAVRVRIFEGTTEVSQLTIAAPSGATPTAKDESRLESSWNVKIPRTLIGPGFAISAEVDPGNVIAEQDESDNRYPRAGGPDDPVVRSSPPLALRFVPVRQQASGLTGDVTAENKARFLELTRRMYPLSGTDGDLHAVYTTTTDEPLTPSDGNGAWVTVLSELNALRVAEGTSRHYYGVVKVDYFSGLAGLGFLGLPTAMGYDRESDRARVMAHELGHTWDRLHSPCGGAGDVDPAYPHPGGVTGAYGIDLQEEVLRGPGVPDIMGYCGSPWISDYTYRGVMDFRGTAAAESVRLSSAPERCLLVWGRVRNGRVELEPAFEVVTRPSLPARPGAYSVTGTADDGATLFRLSFDPAAVADDPAGTAHFAFAVPVGRGRAPLASLRLAGPGGTAAAERTPLPPGAAAAVAPSVDARRSGEGVRVRWNAASHPMAVVRDPGTGEILSFARGGDVEVAGARSEVEVVLSDRVGSRGVVVTVVP